MPSAAELLRAARLRLAATAFATPREAGLLLGHVLDLSEAQLLARDDRAVEPAAAARFAALLERRLRGEPVAYLTGRREFYGRVFAVDDRVLIPRPETEHVVEAALGLPLPPAARILDVATGSGCLALTLALERPAWRVAASDLSLAALAVAAANARHLDDGGDDGQDAGRRVHWLAGDLATAVDLGELDLVVSNPPYIDKAAAAGLSPEVCNFEPHLALFSPGGGDSTLERLFAECGAGLRSGAFVISEIGHDQLAAARRHAGNAGLEVAAVIADYAGIPRVVVLRQPQGARAIHG